ncbi:Gfo/Idh/MocA family protein [Oceanobacillus manasiensis]|uniref:Gfo/Idh/MocA family protein n=1 Tax=Oceanobacillus manasiensis TaxID=586413 RepID=UPI0005A65648|nr:Gfo/Idh/MocA family oxidoreductase [Oceanobacillus manasiensis]
MRIGTVGTSWITESFIDAIGEVAGVELTAVHSRTSEKAEDFARKHGAGHYFTALQEMAKSSQMDCVYIASPNSLHFEQAVAFLKNGKHVICEKPMFASLKEFEGAHRIAEENGVYLFEAMRNLYTPNFQKVKGRLDDVGEVRNVLLHRMKYSSRYDELLAGKEPAIFSRKFAGGALVDLGVYPIAVAVALFGKPLDVKYTPVMLSSGVDGSGTLVLSYQGYVCTILCSKISTSNLESEIQGEAGTISIDNIGSFSNVQCSLRASKGQKWTGESQRENTMTYELESFVQIILEGKTSTYENMKAISREVLAITEAARKQSGIYFEGED